MSRTDARRSPLRCGARECDAETGLYYQRARYYDPGLGRFVSRDPIGLAGGVNEYAYAGGDPVNRTDPTGLAPYCVPVFAGHMWYYNPNNPGTHHYNGAQYSLQCFDMPEGPGTTSNQRAEADARYRPGDGGGPTIGPAPARRAPPDPRRTPVGFQRRLRVNSACMMGVLNAGAAVLTDGAVVLGAGAAGYAALSVGAPAALATFGATFVAEAVGVSGVTTLRTGVYAAARTFATNASAGAMIASVKGGEFPLKDLVSNYVPGWNSRNAIRDARELCPHVF